MADDVGTSEDRRYYSVTTILKVLNREGLNIWRERRVAAAACRVAGSLSTRIAEDGVDATIEYLITSRSTGADRGTAVHSAIEEYARTGTRPPVSAEILPYLDRFDAWAQVWAPKFLALEQAVYSRRYCYAGTLDAIAEIDGTTVLIDWKSHAKPTGVYPDLALQLAAYRYADIITDQPPRRVERHRGYQRYYLLGEPEERASRAMPMLDGGLIVSITPESCVGYPVRCDEMVFNSFLHAVECFRFGVELSRQVVGEPLLSDNHLAKEEASGICQSVGTTRRRDQDVQGASPGGHRLPRRSVRARGDVRTKGRTG